MKKISNIITTCILLLCFLVVKGESAGLVLCFGEDGHISLENIHGATCNNFYPSTHAFNFKEHKNHCVDFALSTGSIEANIIHSKSLETILTAPAVAIVSAPFTPQFKRAGPESFILPALTTNTSVESLRTVVLLI